MRIIFESNPNSYALHLRLGAANMAAGHYAEAETAFRDLVTAGDPLPTSYIGLAQVLLRTGRAEESVAELTAARQKLGANFQSAIFWDYRSIMQARDWKQSLLIRRRYDSTPIVLRLTSSWEK